MVTLEEHIKVLLARDTLDPTTSAVCGYFLLVMNEHYVDKDNTHQGIGGKAGFVDPTGKRMTTKEFLDAITAPEPPEPTRRPRKNAMPHVQGKTQESMGSRPYVPLR